MERNEAKDRQLAAAFTAVNAPNVNNRVVTKMTEPFQMAPDLPLGQPPVRYPDLTTMGGFMPDERQRAEDLRRTAARLAEQDDNQGPTAMELDDMGTMGPKPVHYFDVGEEKLTKEELFRRAFQPRTDTHPTLLW